jgi:hypothetical protein
MNPSPPLSLSTHTTDKKKKRKLITKTITVYYKSKELSTNFNTADVSSIYFQVIK